METVLMIVLIAACAVVLGLLAAPLQKQRELVPIRIRHDEGTQRRSPRR